MQMSFTLVYEDDGGGKHEEQTMLRGRDMGTLFVKLHNLIETTEDRNHWTCAKVKGGTSPRNQRTLNVQ